MNQITQFFFGSSESNFKKAIGKPENLSQESSALA